MGPDVKVESGVTGGGVVRTAPYAGIAASSVDTHLMTRAQPRRKATFI